MGSHGTSGMKKWLLDQTEKNSTPLKNPVLCDQKNNQTYNNFVFASDFSENKNLSKNGEFSQCLMPICF
jgi:hypothetical protein